MNDAPTETPITHADPYGIDALRELIQLLNQSDITEMLIERGDTKLHIKRGAPVSIAPYAPHTSVAPYATTPPLPIGAVPPMFEPPPIPDGIPVEMPAGHTIVAPMVGTFYAAPSPKDRPFVSEGDEIHVGDTVGIVEAMKMMNEIESDVSGRVARILVKNGQPIEYGQPLMVVEPL
jgi:acetyl-CoA carboxylase biotin carboxyl carrier protein